MPRFIRRLSIASVALLIAGIAGCWVLYLHPARDEPSTAEPADAILALGGATASARYANQLFQKGFARSLVLADPYVNGYSQIGSLCPAAPAAPAPRITCFQPDPSTTRGEAMEIGRLARQNRWDDVIVVAPTFQISRARFLVGRCFTGRLRMVDPHNQISTRLWLYEFGYQTAAFAKAITQSGC